MKAEDHELQKRLGVEPEIGLMEWIAPKVFIIRRWMEIVLWEKRNWPKLPWRQHLRAWRRGFFSRFWMSYGLDTEHASKDLRDYLPDFTQMRLGHTPNRPYNDLYSKRFQNVILENAGATMPTLHGHLLRGRIHWTAGGHAEPFGGLEGLLNRGHRLVLKPSVGNCGRGILFVEKADDRYKANRNFVRPEEFRGLLEMLDDYVVTDYVQQGAYARRIYPHAANTLRILTLWDLESVEPFIAAISHRFGRDGWGPTDNFRYGMKGLVAPLDLSTGCLGPATTLDQKQNRYVQLGAHPNTGEAIEGVVIPGWPKSHRELLDIAAQLPATPLIAWDCLQTDGGLVVLEANTTPGYDIWQVHTPVLRDPRARRFYQYFGMAK